MALDRILHGNQPLRTEADVRRERFSRNWAAAHGGDPEDAHVALMRLMFGPGYGRNRIGWGEEEEGA